MEQILLVVQVILAAALIGMVLIQRSDTDGFGLGSGGGGNLLSGRAKANLLTRTTAIIAGLFIINSLILSVMAAHDRPTSIVDTIDAQEQQVAPAPVENKIDVKPAVPSVPNAGETKPVEKPVKKVKPAVDANANTDTTGENKSE